MFERPGRWSALWLTLGLSLAGCGDDDPVSPPPPPPPPQNTAPVATIAASPETVPAGDGNQTVVTLDASGSSDADGDPLSFQWTVPSGTFVNGTDADDETIDVTFPGAAPYTVTVVVRDGRGGEDSAQFTVGLR